MNKRRARRDAAAGRLTIFSVRAHRARQILARRYCCTAGSIDVPVSAHAGAGTGENLRPDLAATAARSGDQLSLLPAPAGHGRRAIRCRFYCPRYRRGATPGLRPRVALAANLATSYSITSRAPSRSPGNALCFCCRLIGSDIRDLRSRIMPACGRIHHHNYAPRN